MTNFSKIRSILPYGFQDLHTHLKVAEKHKYILLLNLSLKNSQLALVSGSCMHNLEVCVCSSQLQLLVNWKPMLKGPYHGILFGGMPLTQDACHYSFKLFNDQWAECTGVGRSALLFPGPRFAATIVLNHDLFLEVLCMLHTVGEL
ncbi:hypothetical protein AMECASPLE_019139 [Ameca splendens]|uniref:Uncharacterized protein n=1 Tax=Ameca splendens TaxID=208324 RepID=A0ABV0ZYN6_9TELE